MALNFNIQQAPFKFGIDESIDPKEVPFGTLMTAMNVVWEKTGRLQKRQGTSILTTTIVAGGGTSISVAKRLGVRGSELFLVDGANLYSYSNALSGWVNHGQLPECGLEWSTAVDAAMGVAAADSAILSDGRIVEAWVTGDTAASNAVGTAYYQIRDFATGVVTQPPVSLSAIARPRIRVMANGTAWNILFMTSGGVLAYMAPSLGSANTLLSGMTTNTFTNFDAYVSGTDFVLVATTSGGGMSISRYTIQNTGPATVVAALAVAGESSSVLASIGVAWAPNETVYIVYSTGAAVKFAAANPTTLAQTVAPTVIDSGGNAQATCTVTRLTSTSCLAVYSIDGVAPGVTKSFTITNAGTATQKSTAYFQRVVSRPFQVGTAFYCVYATDPRSGKNAFTTAGLPTVDTFVVDVMPFANPGQKTPREVGKVDVDIGGSWSNGFVSTACAAVTGITTLAVGYQDTPSVSAFGVRQGIRSVKILTGASVPVDMWNSTELGGEAHIVTGVLAAYDGVEATPYGWAHPPYIDESNTSTATTGGFILAGIYDYNVTAERRSAAGLLHRSPVGFGKLITTTGTTSADTIGIIPIAIGAPITIPGQVLLYRSTVGGSIPQRIAVEPSTLILSSDTFTGAYPMQVVDTYGDNLIASSAKLSIQPALYTAGGELEDTQVPGFVTTCLYRNRIWGIAGDRLTIYFSKDSTNNPGVAPGFNPDLRIVMNEKLTGLTVLDERLVIFSENSIFYMSGDGPADDGSASDYGTPNRLQTDVGSTNPRGTVSTPMGIFFVNGNDTRCQIFLIDRKLNVSWIGQPVQDLIDSYPNVTSAVLVSSKGHIRFTCQAPDGASGIVLVYDYIVQQWSHFVYGASLPIADAVIHQGVYTFVTTSGVVYKESETTWLDNGAFVTSRLETAWAYAEGPLSYQSVRNFQIEGSSSSAHGLNIYVGFNGNTTYEQGPKTWAEGVSGVTAPGDISAAKVSIGTRRKCRSIRFKIEDTAPAVLGTGQGGKWSLMGIEVGAKRGFGPLALRQKE